MILKIDDLGSKEFASLSSFLASEQNVLKEHLHDDGSPVRVIGSQYALATHFAELTTSKGNYGSHNVVLELQEKWVSVDDRGKRLGESSDTESHPLPTHYLLELMRAIGRYAD